MESVFQCCTLNIGERQCIINFPIAQLLKDSINGWSRNGLYPITQKSHIATLEENPKPPPEVRDCLPLHLTSVPRQGTAQLLHPPFCQPPMDSATRGGGGNALTAVLLCSPHLPFVGKCEGIARFSSCLGQCCILEGMQQDISRTAPGSENLPPLMGASPAWAAVSKMASVRCLCLLILSPPTPQQRAWSLGCFRYALFQKNATAVCTPPRCI